MRTRKSAGALAVVMLFFASLTYAEWVEIPVSAVLETLPEDRILRDEGEQPVGFVDDRGIERLPDCSDGLLDPNARSFSFFVDRADTGGNEDLLIYFAGGGACWDATTCVGTLVEPDAQPTATSDGELAFA